MAKKIRQKRPTRQVALLFLGLLGFSVFLTFMLQGTDVRVMNPKGIIAGEQLKLMIFSVAVMLVIGIPTLGLLYYFAWKYREDSPKATYNAQTRHGLGFNVFLWGVPTIFMLVLASVMWPSTHRLEPKKPISSDVKPMTVQVIALQWKWLFIYPEQKIATVNFVQIPVDTPIRFELTADEAPMNSFWIPHLGGQLYAMTGHSNPLHLIADETGDFPGSAAEINGHGFAGMKFTARASSQEDFEKWVESVKSSQASLDEKTYKELLKPSESNPVTNYASYHAGLYDTVLMKYNGGASHHGGGHGGAGYH